jgi:hypothetical protein
MTKKILNPCTRCGKERVVTKSFKEKSGTFTVTRTLSVCPDPECQRIVNGALNKEKEKRDVFKKESEKREHLRQRRIQISRKK